MGLGWGEGWIKNVIVSKKVYSLTLKDTSKHVSEAT